MSGNLFRNSHLLIILSLYTLMVSSVSAATISGKILFDGKAPEIEKATADADPACQMLHPDGVSMEEVVVNANGTLKNVFVYVKQGLGEKTFENPTTPVVLDQKGCQYQPHVFGIQVNQPLEILNSDDTLHNVHALPKNTKEFNLGMPIKGMKIVKTFTAPEIMVKMKCEVHPWMACYAGVVNHPFYAVSNEEGTFSIKDLAPGQYVLEAWHEKYGTQSLDVTVSSAEETASVTFQYKS